MWRASSCCDKATPEIFTELIAPWTDDTLIAVGSSLGDNRAAFQNGDDLYLRKRPGRTAGISPDFDGDGLPDLVVSTLATADLDGDGLLDVVSPGRIEQVVIRDDSGRIRWTDRGAGEKVLALVFSGIDRDLIQRGDLLSAVSPKEDTQCPEGITDEQLIEQIARQAKLPVELANVAYVALLNNIIRATQVGEVVDLGGFGTFAVETTVTVSIEDPCAGTPENCPPADPDTAEPAVEWESSVLLSGADGQEVTDVAGALLATAEARRGRNPQTGKEIKIAAKNKVKFKAGAELSGQVN